MIFPPHQVVYRAVHLVRQYAQRPKPWVIDSVLPPHHGVGSASQPLCQFPLAYSVCLAPLSYNLPNLHIFVFPFQC